MPADSSKHGEIHKSETERRYKLRGFPVCDFAADADAAEQLLVGRVLTVKRVRELNAKDYFYQMLKSKKGSSHLWRPASLA
jgi:hypothetical protein